MAQRRQDVHVESVLQGAHDCTACNQDDYRDVIYQKFTVNSPDMGRQLGWAS